MKKILITGGTGLIGSHLCNKFHNKGYEVVILSRTKKPGSKIPVFIWDYKTNEIDIASTQSIDHIIHLAGANIGEKRWTTKRKREIVDSRVKSAELILSKVIEQNIKVKSFITSSAIGYYGAVTSDTIFNEEDDHFNDFIGNTCKLWEQSADRFQSIGIRTVKIRTGIVMTSKGGPLAKMISPLKFRIGSLIGGGSQYLPWIHIDDLCNIYIKAVEDSNMNGAYNAVSPEHLNYRDFIKKISVITQKSILNVTIPSFVIRIIFGKMSEMILNGSRVSSDKIINAGYSFKFPFIQSALKDLLLKDSQK